MVKTYRKGSSIKTKHLGHMGDWVPNGTFTVDIVQRLWQPQTDISIVGFNLQIATLFDTGTPAYTEGTANQTVYLAINSPIPVAEEIPYIVGALHSYALYWTEIVVATQTAGLFGSFDDDLTVMFPSGKSIDMDPDDIIYLVGTTDARIISADNLANDFGSIIYYIER